MAIASNLLTSTILAPLVVILSSISLATLQRGLEWVNTIASTPQKGFLRQIKPALKVIDAFVDRILGGGKFSITPTNILLMAVIITLLCLLLEGNEKPKRVAIVDRKKSE
eukprot:gene592-637_t